MKNFVEELKWRGMIQDIMPGTEEKLMEGPTAAYVGIDPTADSLHIGHMVSIMILKHFQECGHKPIALVGGATGMIGDPSGKSQERNLLDEETLNHNIACIKKQLSKFLDFESDAPNKAELVNNYDWMKDYGFLNFIRDVGKHITVNYMMAKDSVKMRLSNESREGMSFTEFSYQLLQGYDFLWLYENKNCRLEMGGSDQWGNITAGIDTIRKMHGSDAKAYGLTIPLMLKSDGTKFGKTAGGAVWLDPEKTSPFEFYQFWLNQDDADVVKYLKYFTFLSKEEIDALAESVEKEPEKRLAQRRLAEEVTTFVHSPEALKEAQNITEALYHGSIADLSESELEQAFGKMPTVDVSNEDKDVVNWLVDSQIYKSKRQAREDITHGAVTINGIKVTSLDEIVKPHKNSNGKFVIVRKGKKKYTLARVHQ